MSQSCQSLVPPLHFEDEDFDDPLENNYNMIGSASEQDLRGDISLNRYLDIGSRFSDISIEERKDRINILIHEIYGTNPMSRSNSTRRSLNQKIKKYASMDQVSDVGSVISGTSKAKQSGRSTKLTR